MWSYRGHELWVLLLLAASLAVGMGTAQFRRAQPERFQALEDADREEPPPAPPPAKPSERPPKERGWRPPTQALEDLPKRSLDINSASAEELRQLPGISAELAQRIVEYRQKRGPFKSPGEIRWVPGMGPRRAAAIQELITVE